MQQISEEKIATVIAIIVALAVLPTYLGLFNGSTSLSEAFIPFWAGFAENFPVIFGFSIVGAAFVLGGDNVADILDM